MSDEKTKRLTDILRAEANGYDLQDCGSCVFVCAEAEDGELYTLGAIPRFVFELADASVARTAISKIKFNR